MRLRLGSAWVLPLACLAAASGQEPATRAEILEGEAREKATHLKPDEPTKGERIFKRITEGDWIGRITGGFPGLRLKTGGLAAGSGFALGPEYARPDLFRENLSIRASAVGSFKLYYKMDAEVALPRLANNHFAISFLGAHSDYNAFPYYGQGQGSLQQSKTNFRREDTSFDLQAGWRPYRRTLLLGVRGGALGVNVGPGQGGTPSSETRFRPSDTVGILEQSTFLRGGPFIEIDFRDTPGDPHRGGNYGADWMAYSDQRHGSYSFHRFEGHAEQYIPFLNEKRVFALRARTVLSYRGVNQQVPFYLQPTLGGPNDLRGYDLYRFYDNNLILLSGEYRWEVFPGLDMAVFGDGGKVFRRLRQFNLHGMDGGGGVGFRIKSRDRVVLRMDLGASPEGFHVWLNFGNAF